MSGPVWVMAEKLVFRFAGHRLLPHCGSWWAVGDFTGQCSTVNNSQPVGAKFGRGDQVPLLCTWHCPSCPSHVPSLLHILNRSRDSLWTSSSLWTVLSCVICSTEHIHSTSVGWTSVCLRWPEYLVLLLWFSTPAYSFSIGPPAVVLGRWNTLRTCFLHWL